VFHIKGTGIKFSLFLTTVNSDYTKIAQSTRELSFIVIIT